MSITSLTNRRLITGIFRELEQCEISFISNEIDHPFSGRIVPFQNNPAECLLIDNLTTFPQTLEISFWVNHRFYRCKIAHIQGNFYELPTELILINNRSAERIYAEDISSAPVLIVLSLFTKKLFGKLKNINSNFILAEFDSLNGDISKYDKGEAVALLNGKIIGKYIVEVERTDLVGVNAEILLQITAQSLTGMRATFRGNNDFEFALNLSWPDGDGFSSIFTIEEISGLGMSGFISDDSHDLYPIGTILTESATGARLRIAWKAQKRIGFSLEPSEPGRRERLARFLKRNENSSQKGVRAKARQTQSILTRAGLLKGERSLSYANKNKSEQFLNRAGASTRWLREYGDELRNISFLRVSDDGWVIQELASCSDSKGLGAKLILEGIKSFAVASQEEISPNASLIGMYDTLSKFNIQFWRGEILNYLKTPPEYFSLVLGRIKDKKFSVRSTENTSMRIERLSPSLWSTLGQSQLFQSALFNSFGINANDYSCRLLSSILQSDSQQLERTVYVAKSNNGRPCGIILKLGLPALSNATSLLENLYLFPICNKFSNILPLIFCKDSEFLIGVEDVCIVGGSGDITKCLTELLPGFEPRVFELTLVPINSLRGDQI